ncbi:hypothetical protein CYMTET_19536, partial [Cymbomonas tetramitiformis]
MAVRATDLVAIYTLEWALRREDVTKRSRWQSFSNLLMTVHVVSHGTVSAAIRAAAEGDIVELSPGIYNESVLLDKLVHLRAAPSPPAENPPPVVIKGIDGAPAVSISGAAYKGGSLRGLTLASDEGPSNASMEALPAGADEGGEQGTGEEEAGAARQCVVLCSGGLAAGEAEQFEIRGCRVEGGKSSAAGVHIIGAEVRVALTDTTVKSTGGWGVLCAGGGVVILSDCGLLENIRGGCRVEADGHVTLKKTRVCGNAVGVDIEGGAALTDCVVVENTGDGIVLRGECNPTVESTEVSGNGRNGVAVYGHARGIFDSCNIWVNLNGIAVAEGGNSMFRNAEVHDNEESGIRVADRGQGSFEGCEVYANKMLGIFIKGSGDPSVTNTKVHSNKQVGIWVCEQGQGRFEGCEVYENTLQGIVIKGSGNPSVTNTKVHGNKQSGITVFEQEQGSFKSCEVYGNERGVYVVEQGQGSFDGWQGSFDGCEVCENTLHGISINGSGDPSVTNTKVHSNKQVGIRVFEQGQGSFDGCEVCENTLHGVSIRGSGNPSLTNTKVHANHMCGLVVGDDGAGTLEGCGIHRNGDHGVHLKNRATLNVTGGHVSENTACGIVWDDEAGGSLTSTTVHGNREHGLHLRGASCPVVRQAVLYRNGGAPVVMQEGAGGRFEECGEMGGVALTLRALLRRAGEAKARWRELQQLGPEVRQDAHQGVPGSPPVALAQVDTQLRALDCTVREIEEHTTASIPELSTLSALQEQRRTLAAEIAATLAEACRELPEQVRRAEEAAERMTAAAESHRARQLLAGAAEGGAGQQEEAHRSEAEVQWRPCGVVEAAGDAAAEERTRLPGTRERAALEAGEREVELWEAAARAELAQLEPRAQAALQLAVHQRALLAHYTARLPSLQTLPAREGKCTQLVEELEDLELKQQELKVKEVELQHLENPARKRRKLLLA